MEQTVTKDEKLTLEKLQNHLIKTVVGALAVAVVTALLSSYGYSIRTTDTINQLTESHNSQQGEIKELQNGVQSIKSDVSDIKTSLSNTTIYTTYNKENIKSIEAEISDIKKSQEETLKLLYEIRLKK